MLIKLNVVLCLVLSGGANTMRTRIAAINEDREHMIRHSQNTFIQWVQSLLPQRPTYETLTGLSGTITTTLAPVTIGSITSTVKATTILTTPAAALASTPSPGIGTGQPALATTTMQSLESLEMTLKPEVNQSAIATPPTPATSARPTTAATTTTMITTTLKPTMIPKPIEVSTSEPIILNPARNCSECFCGIANIQKRIVGGQETEVNQYPWMSMLLYGGRFYCAGTLINDQYVITASHCVYGFRRERITVRLLEHDRKMSGIHRIDRRIVEIITHPKYNARTYDNDIAIVKLEKPVELNELLHPVCLPTPGKSFKGELGIVTGWGALKVGGPTSDTLQEVHVPIMSQEDCRKSRYGASRITDNMLCAGYDEGKKDSCQGDSGGPLHIVSPGTREHQLAGVVSWGEGCAKAGYPGVYARVNRYGTWIKSMTKNACICVSEAKKIKKSLSFQ